MLVTSTNKSARCDVCSICEIGKNGKQYFCDKSANHNVWNASLRSIVLR